MPDRGAENLVLSDVAEAVALSDVDRALDLFDAAMAGGENAMSLHRALFFPAQKVLNPPFINPHLPKMHAICRELMPLLYGADLASLVRLEVSEYAQRPKLSDVHHWRVPSGVAFDDVIETLSGSDVAATAASMMSYWDSAGGEEFTRNMVLLGSGYLGSSLGHSISCTAFILLEALQRQDQDRWPVCVLLADYFHKGGFSRMPERDERALAAGEMDHHLMRATTGGGIGELHDTITIYAIEAVGDLFNEAERRHLINAWIAYLKTKEARPAPEVPSGRSCTFDEFVGAVSTREPAVMYAAALPYLREEKGCHLLVTNLLKAVCALYRGSYNPHVITGLGSLLWLFDRRPPPEVAANGLHQYLSFLASALPAGAD